MDKFLKIQNFQTCKEAFSVWMDKTYAFNIVANNVQAAADKMLFETMRQVKDEFVDDPAANNTIKDLNDISLERLEGTFVATYKLQKTPLQLLPAQQQPQQPNQMMRDASAFGNRPIGTRSFLPIRRPRPIATTLTLIINLTSSWQTARPT